MKKHQPTVLLIIGQSQEKLDELIYELTKSMIPGTFLGFSGYSAKEIQVILENLTTNDPVLKLLYFTSMDLATPEVVKSKFDTFFHLNMNS